MGFPLGSPLFACCLHAEVAVDNPVKAATKNAANMSRIVEEKILYPIQRVLSTATNALRKKAV